MEYKPGDVISWESQGNPRRGTVIKIVLAGESMFKHIPADTPKRRKQCMDISKYDRVLVKLLDGSGKPNYFGPRLSLVRLAAKYTMFDKIVKDRDTLAEALNDAHMSDCPIGIKWDCDRVNGDCVKCCKMYLDLPERKSD